MGDQSTEPAPDFEEAAEAAAEGDEEVVEADYEIVDEVPEK